MKYAAPLLTFLLLAGTVHAAAPKAPEAPEPPEVFEKLKALAGEWRGSTGKEGKPGGIDYRVTAGGSVVMETLLPGTAQEMISMYFVDRGQLRLTHYCAVGNQPEMIYDRKHSTPTEYFFKFDGGRGFSMRDDLHVHDGTIKIIDARHLEATWNVWGQGKSVDAHHFVLTRAAKP